MSELSRRISEENERLSRNSIARLTEANRYFDTEIEKIAEACVEKQEGSLLRDVAWVAFAALVFYACVWGILAL
jgi:hypothetical protein